MGASQDALWCLGNLVFIRIAGAARAGEARALLLEPGNGMLKSPRIAELFTLAPRPP